MKPVAAVAPDPLAVKMVEVPVHVELLQTERRSHSIQTMVPVYVSAQGASSLAQGAHRLLHETRTDAPAHLPLRGAQARHHPPKPLLSGRRPTEEKSLRKRLLLHHYMEYLLIYFTCQICAIIHNLLGTRHPDLWRDHLS